MNFPNIALSIVKDKLKQAFDDNGNDGTARLHDTGATFPIKVLGGFRRTYDLTEGMQQEQHRLKVFADDWDALALRPPEKGDRITVLGETHLVQTRVRSPAIQNMKFVYVMEVLG